MIASVVAIFVYSLGEQQFFAIETASFSWFIVGLLLFYAHCIKTKKIVVMNIIQNAKEQHSIL